MGMEAAREDQAIVAVVTVVGEVSAVEEDTVIRDRGAVVVSVSRCPPLVTMCTCEDFLWKPKYTQAAIIILVLK